MSVTKFQTHTKQQAKLYFYISLYFCLLFQLELHNIDVHLDGIREVIVLNNKLLK